MARSSKDWEAHQPRSSRRKPGPSIVASQRNGTLYVGSTDNLAKRIWDHKVGAGSAFTARHGVNLLVWFEQHETRDGAFRRERQIKEWKRLWKLELIERSNPGWIDLYETYHP